jgi:hypothetical protein
LSERRVDDIEVVGARAIRTVVHESCTNFLSNAGAVGTSARGRLSPAMVMGPV